MKRFILFICVLFTCVTSPIQALAHIIPGCNPGWIDNAGNFSINSYNAYDPGDIVVGSNADIWFTAQVYSTESILVQKLLVHGNAKKHAVTEYPWPIKGDFGPGPHDIALAKDKTLWFTAQPDIIGRITETGKVTLFHTPTPASVPSTIIADSDGIWFIEQAASRIGRITPQGKITEFRITNNQNTNLKISGMVRGPDGNLWFTEQQTNTIGRITPQGKVREYALPKGPMQTPLAITSGPNGNLWFTDAKVNEIGEITPNGKITEHPFTLPHIPYSGLRDIITGPDGNLWAALNADGVISISPQLKIVQYHRGSSDRIYSFSFAPDGTFWATAPGAIFTFDFCQSPPTS